MLSEEDILKRGIVTIHIEIEASITLSVTLHPSNYISRVKIQFPEEHLPSRYFVIHPQLGTNKKFQ